MAKKKRRTDHTAREIAQLDTEISSLDFSILACQKEISELRVQRERKVRRRRRLENKARENK